MTRFAGISIPSLPAALFLLLLALPSRLAAQLTVRIVATGDVGQYAGMCGTDAGEDKLTGTLDLVSFDDEDNTAFYEGVLDRTTSVDACGVIATGDGEDWCVGHLDGSARMRVTLEVYEDDRGAYLEVEPTQPPGPVKKQIGGCAEAGEWLDAYPDDGLLSGLAFEDVPSGRLLAGNYEAGNVKLEVR